MPIMAKSHAKENGKSRENHDNDFLLERINPPLSSHGSPGIMFRPEFIYEAFDLNASYAGNTAVSNTNETSLSLQQAIRENKLGYVRQYSQTGHDLNVVDGNGFTALHHAAIANHVEVLSMLLDCQADVNYQGQQLLTPLHVAVRYNSSESVKILVEYNADPSIKNVDGATPLHFAARRGCANTSKLLLSHTLSSVNSPDHSGMTPFHLACVSGNQELCETFLKEHRADICARTVEEKSPLHLVALHGNKDIVQLLINEAILEFDNPIYYINAPDFEGNTPLHLTCQKGHVETAKLLLGYGADVVDGEKLWNKHTPLHLAAASGHMAVVELLISHNAPVDCKDEMQRTPLQRAAEFDRVDIVKYLLDIGADMEAKDNANRTAFVCAVKRGRTRAAELLLESGADFESRDEALRTCIHLAVQYERVDTLRMLLDRDQGKLINERDKDLRTPLHYAAKLGSLKILQILLEKKCTVAPFDVFERSPLHAAAEKGHVSCVEELCLSAQGHVNDKDERGLTPLHLAARESHSETCSLLLHMGAHTMIRDSNRWTAMHHCAAGGCARTTEALLVYHSTLPLEATDEEGNTPLHLAAKCGHVDIVELMLSHGVDITVCNNQKMTSLDVAIECGKEKVAEVFIKNDKWKNILQYKAERGVNPMKNLIQSMPRLAEKVMSRCITYSDLPRHDPEYTATFDFSLLECDGESEFQGKPEGRRFFGPETMVESEREALLMHPLSQGLLQWKWLTLGMPLFWANFLTYLFFVGLLTAFAVSEREKQRVLSPDSVDSTFEDNKIFRNKSTFSTGVPVMIVIFICLHMVKELYQITVQQWRYFTHFTNLTEWCCYITGLCYVAPYILEQNIFSRSMALWPLASTVTLLSYLNVILFLRRFSFFGLYVSMFFEVTRTFIRVLFIFTPVIFSFSLVFFLLLKEQNAFSSVWWSLLKTAIMMVGEIDYGSIIVDSMDLSNEGTGAPLVPTPHFSSVVVCFFCMMVSVLLMNLLVGLAVGDIDSIQRDANMRRLAMQVEFVSDINQRYPRFLRKWFHKSVLDMKPNRIKKFPILSKMTVDLFPKAANLTEGGAEDVAEVEPGESRVSGEVAKQREQIKRLQNAVEDQSRILQEISHQLKQAARPQGSSESSA